MNMHLTRREVAEPYNPHVLALQERTDEVERVGRPRARIALHQVGGASIVASSLM